MLTSTITWSNPVDTADPIQIEKTAGGPFAPLVTLQPAATTYVDGANVDGTTVSYRVAYVTPAGLGPYAGPVSKTFPAPPPAPATTDPAVLARLAAVEASAAASAAKLEAVKKAVCQLSTSSTLRNVLRTALGATGCVK